MSAFKLYLFPLVSACVLAASLFSCASWTSGRSFRSPVPANQVEVNAQEEGITDLTVYLRRIAGVQVSGDGGNAVITIRGINSINMSSSPLFVIDGKNVGKDYSQVYDMIMVDQVKRVTVLKSASETGIYGVQGANGVILIETKF